ncbi:hypothetical protein Tco_1002124 [Tanacetum coccineum]|uniref:Uncharacterized protein n=1 Tax=Tanacetum coccineum TaxID=301880 RepID=A0ABQ5F5G6_9ASTR
MMLKKLSERQFADSSQCKCSEILIIDTSSGDETSSRIVSDEEIEKKKLEAHYGFMAKIQEDLPAESSSIDTPLEQLNPEKPRLYEIPYDTSDPAKQFCPNGEETVTLEKAPFLNVQKTFDRSRSSLGLHGDDVCSHQFRPLKFKAGSKSCSLSKQDSYITTRVGITIPPSHSNAEDNSHKVVRLGINPMIQPEPEDLPKDNPKLEIAVLRLDKRHKIARWKRRKDNDKGSKVQESQSHRRTRPTSDNKSKEKDHKHSDLKRTKQSHDTHEGVSSMNSLWREIVSLNFY